MNTPLRLVLKATPWVVVFYFFLIIGCYIGNYGRSTYQPTTHLVLREGWGFETDQSYPLRLGAPVDGSVGSVSGKTSFFLIGGSSSLHGQVQPMTSVRMQIDNAGISYILVIPVSHVKFHQQAGPATAIFTTDNEDEKRLPPLFGKVIERTGSTWTLNQHHVFQFPALTAYSEWSVLLNEGLGAYLQAHTTAVDLTLTPEQFNSYLGVTS